MKSLFFSLFFLILSLAIASCEKNTQQPTSDCLEGTIPVDTFYRDYHKGCFANSYWLSVDPKYKIGRDVTVLTPFPVNNPTSQTQYSNVVEAALPKQISESTRKDTLLGRKFYFRYRPASAAEIDQLRVKTDGCTDVARAYGVPVIVITSFSLDGCPPNTD